MTEYSFENSIILVNGVPIDEFADGDDVLQGSRNVDAFSHVIGVQGNMMINITADKSGAIIMRLQEGGRGSAYLNGLFLIAEVSGFSPIIVSIIDVTTGVTFGGAAGYITRPADISRGGVSGTLEWTIVVEKYNALFTPALIS